MGVSPTVRFIFKNQNAPPKRDILKEIRIPLYNLWRTAHNAEHFSATLFAGASHGPALFTALALHGNLLGVHHLPVLGLALNAVSSSYWHRSFIYICHIYIKQLTIDS